MNKWRRETFMRLARLGFTGEDAAALVRCSATLRTWAEHECNGVIQRDEETGVPYVYNTFSGKRLSRTSDRETGALKRAAAVAESRGFKIYHQGDPRGCALYLYRSEDLDAYRERMCPDREPEDVGIDCCYNSIGYGVIP